MDSIKDTGALNLRKVIEGRKKWRKRSNLYQSEKRKLQDQVRYLKRCLQEKDEQLHHLQHENRPVKKSPLFLEMLKSPILAQHH